MRSEGRLAHHGGFGRGAAVEGGRDADLVSELQFTLSFCPFSLLLVLKVTVFFFLSPYFVCLYVCMYVCTCMYACNVCVYVMYVCLRVGKRSFTRKVLILLGKKISFSS